MHSKGARQLGAQGKALHWGFRWAQSGGPSEGLGFWLVPDLTDLWHHPWLWRFKLNGIRENRQDQVAAWMYNKLLLCKRQELTWMHMHLQNLGRTHNSVGGEALWRANTWGRLQARLVLSLFRIIFTTMGGCHLVLFVCFMHVLSHFCQKVSVMLEVRTFSAKLLLGDHPDLA